MGLGLMVCRLISMSRSWEHVEACLRNVRGRSLLLNMTPETAAGEAHTHMQKQRDKHVQTLEKHWSPCLYWNSHRMKCNLKISSNSKLWEAKAAAQDHTKDPTKKNIRNIPTLLCQRPHICIWEVSMSQKCTFTDFVVFVVISMKKKKKKDCQIRLL